MSTVDKTLIDKEEFHPTVLSQSFADTMLSTSLYYTNNFWDTLVLQQQQQQLDSVYNTLSKPIGNASQDIYHESNPAAALLTVGAPRMGIHDLIATPFDPSYFMPCHQPSVIKDDVFLAQPSVNIDIDDNVSLSSHSTLSSFQHGDKSVASPCLSPVTSPTNFLYNHEPLFEGGIIEAEETAAMAYDGEDEEYDDFISISSEPAAKQQARRLSTTEDLDWFKLLDAFRADVACDIPACSETAIQDVDDCLSLGNLSSESDMDDCALLPDPISRISNKRKRITEKAPKKSKSTKPPQKRPRKAKTTIKRQMKKTKKSLLNPHIQKSTSIHNTEEYHDLDQNKETDNRHQLTEIIAEDEKTDNKTMFQQLTDAGIDWCRYCGTTEGVNWRPGPWGKRTLCNKHGCDYKGYGLANRMPRLDLSAFLNETLDDRARPVVQEFCVVCQCPEQDDKEAQNQLIYCQGGCSRAYHQQCHKPMITTYQAMEPVRWYCSALCKENRKLKKVVVELPRKHTPLMHLLPKSKKKTIA